MTAGRRADPRAEAPSLAELWRVATPLTRAALLVAGSSAAVIVGTFLGLTASGPGLAVYVLHLAAMLLGLTLVGRVMWHHLWTIRRPHAEPPGHRSPILKVSPASLCRVAAVVQRSPPMARAGPSRAEASTSGSEMGPMCER